MLVEDLIKMLQEMPPYYPVEFRYKDNDTKDNIDLDLRAIKPNSGFVRVELDGWIVLP